MIQENTDLLPFPKPSSLAHQHVFACLNTILVVSKRSPKDIRVLDAGCGNGHLMSFIYRALKSIHRDLELSVYGFDVSNHGVQDTGFFDKTIETLKADVPEVNWSEHTKILKIGDSWGYPSGYFDVVISNQVLEHVQDKKFFFSEMSRVLRDGGYAVHLFPLAHYIYEGHLLLPFVHRIRSHDLLRFYISFLSIFGLGKFKIHNTQSGISRREFSEKHADYMYFCTSYVTEKQIMDIAKKVASGPVLDLAMNSISLSCVRC